MRALSDLESIRIPDAGSEVDDEQALDLALAGHIVEARRRLESLRINASSPIQQARILNDLSALDAVAGDWTSAARSLEAALAFDPDCRSAQLNRERLKMIEAAFSTPLVPASGRPMRFRIAILSLLFNWPSTGGGTIHTYEAAKFLQQDGYEVRHFYARYDEWGLGQVTEPLAVESQALHFSSQDWRPDEIRRRFRAALVEFAPDAVLIADSWNTKPLLAEAAQGYPYCLRIAALEGLCPLNNVRLLVDETGTPRQCGRCQLAEPQA